MRLPSRTYDKNGQTHIEVELNNILEIIKVLPDECVVVDAGANIGLVALPIAQAISDKKGVLHAYEPQRMMAYALCGAAALNDLENLHVYNQALGASCDSIAIATPNYSEAQDFGLFSLAEQHVRPTCNINQVSIDSLNLPRLDFLKIDVEGLEIDVLKGSEKTLETHQPWCWIEYWKLDVADIKQQF